MKACCLALVVGCLFFACKHTGKGFRSETQTLKRLNSTDIVGAWKLQGEGINFGVIEFDSDSTTEFSTRQDTIFRYNYLIRDSVLILVDETNDTTVNKILRLDNSHLILESVRRTQKVHTYQRYLL